MTSVQGVLWFQTVFMGVLSAQMSVREATYNRVKDPSLGMLALSAPWTVTSLSKCAVACSFWFDVCYSFTYNHDTGLCTLGERIKSTYPAPTPEQGDLYTRRWCTAEGFQLVEYMNGEACVFVSQDSKTYLEAAQACEDMDAHLTSIKVMKKFDLFVSAMEGYSPDNFWIGLDDMQSEGNFFWYRDGSAFNITLKALMFTSGQPDNRLQNENCVEYQTVKKGFNDFVCSEQIRYVCERFT